MALLRYRGYLPHLESSNSTYFLTFRLIGSVPARVIENWKLERKEIRDRVERQKRTLTAYERKRLKYLFSVRIEKYLDQLSGQCWLKDPVLAKMVVDALKYFDGIHYNIHAWCVMPNHVHVVFTVTSKTGGLDSSLIPIIHSWKSYTAHKANKILKRKGAFWQDEYYDRLIRSNEEFAHYIDYTLQNPVKAKLCATWPDWPWNGCSEKVKQSLS
jgi:REP element-mobilizing transposase RayT